MLNVIISSIVNIVLQLNINKTYVVTYVVKNEILSESFDKKPKRFYGV